MEVAYRDKKHSQILTSLKKSGPPHLAIIDRCLQRDSIRHGSVCLDQHILMVSHHKEDPCLSKRPEAIEHARSPIDQSAEANHLIDFVIEARDYQTLTQSAF